MYQAFIHWSLNRGRGEASLCNSLGTFSWVCIQVETLQARQTKVSAHIRMSCWNQWVWGKDFIFRRLYQEGTLPPNASIVFLQSCYAHILVFLWLMKIQVLPHVKRAGYNAIQLIGIPEHKDYYTVGYRVSMLKLLSLKFVFLSSFAIIRIHHHFRLLISLLSVADMERQMTSNA